MDTLILALANHGYGVLSSGGSRIFKKGFPLGVSGLKSPHVHVGSHITLIMLVYSNEVTGIVQKGVSAEIRETLLDPPLLRPSLAAQTAFFL